MGAEALGGERREFLGAELAAQLAHVGGEQTREGEPQSLVTGQQALEAFGQPRIGYVTHQYQGQHPIHP
jgi:hypothetical protein